MLSQACFIRTPVMIGKTINDLCAEWLVVMSSWVKLSTLANYRMKLDKHIIPSFGECLVTEITCPLAQAFIEKKLSEGL